MDDKSTLASLDAQNQWHNTDEKNMQTIMCDYYNDAQGASIEAALQERIERVADAERDGNEVMNQVTCVPSLVDLFAGYGWRKEMTAKRTKLTKRYLHEMQYLHLGDDETTKGEGACTAPLDREFYQWVPSFFYPLMNEYADNAYQYEAAFLGMLTAMSAAFPGCYITDRGRELGTCLLTFIAGLTGDGKGGITKPREVLKGIDDLLQQQREEAMKQYRKEYALYKRKEEELMKLCKGDQTEKSVAAEEQYMALEEPEKPIAPVILAPVDTTLPRLIIELSLNGGHALFQVEQEMAMSLLANGQEHGGSLLLLLKAFEEEFYDKAIKTNMERQSIPNPRISYLGTMTHEQMPEFLGTLGSGLPSRSLILAMPEKYSEYIPEEYGTEALKRAKHTMTVLQEIAKDMYLTLIAKSAEGMKFTLTFTPAQHEQMNRYFEQKENLVKAMYDDRDGLVSIIRRARTIAKRSLLVLWAFKQYDKCGSWDKVFGSEQLVPSDTDVDHALYLANHFCECTLNALHYYGIIKPRESDNSTPKRMDKREIINTMNDIFTWAELKHLACDQHRYAVRNLEDDRWIGAWIKAGLIAVVSGEGNGRTFRKLTKRERIVFSKKSQKAKQRAVNKQIKRK